MRLGGGFMIPVKHDQQGEIPLMMPRHRPLGYPPSSRLSLAQPNLAEIHGDACDGKPTRGGGFTSFGLLNDEELECKSGSENLECGGGGGGGACSGEDQDGDHSRPRKKRYHRHTQHQIQELEMFFKECPHPDEKQRKALSKELGLEPLQVKFWFQNKRTQMKTQHERMENSQLKAENEKLIAENIRYKEALAHATCPSCGGPATLGEISFDENELRIENARLRDEIDRVSSVAAKYIGKPLNSLSSALPNSCGVPRSGLGMEMCGIPSAIQGISVNSNRFLAATEVEKAMVVEVAVAAMEELMKIAQMGPSLWNSCTLADENTLSEVLNEEEYLRNFRPVIGPRPYGFRSEASRDSAVVMMSPVSIVETLMDVNQWCSMFPDIVSGGSTIEILPTGVAGNFNGALQVMYAELQLPTPLVTTRENYFCRYCKQHSEGFWAVVDVSLENLRGSPPPSMIKCRRRPSGLLIQEMPDGYSKVTWVEHVEVEDQPIHSICRHLVTSGMGFGAKRWLATLARQSERLASAMATAIPPSELSVIPNQEGRKSVLKLAQRMVASFCSRVGASTDQSWTNISASDAENIRVTTRKSTDDTSRPPGILLNEATSLWLPLSHDRVFDFLRDDSTRSEWDIMSNGGVVQEMAHIANGQDPANYVSLLRVNGVNPNQVNTLILQETSRDACASFVIYAPVDLTAMNAVLNGGNPDFVALLPSGFAILPDYSQKNGSGCLLSVAFQILVDSDPNAKLSLGSVAIVNTLISCTLDRIKSALISPASYQTNNNNITTSPANPPP